MPYLFRSIGSAALAAGLALSMTTTAGAESLVLKDERADVWQYADAGPGFDPVGRSVANVDLARTVVRHRLDDVVVRVEYAKFKDRFDDEISFDGYIRTDERNFRLSVGIDNFGKWALRVGLYRGLYEHDVDCPKLNGRVRFGQDVMRIRVPRSCLGNPPWIKFCGTAELYQESNGLFFDEATSDRAVSRAWGPRIRRG